MKSELKKPYTKPQLTIYGSMEEMTQQTGTGSIDALIGIDIDGDGSIDAPTSVVAGSV